MYVTIRIYEHIYETFASEKMKQCDGGNEARMSRFFSWVILLGGFHLGELRKAVRRENEKVKASLVTSELQGQIAESDRREEAIDAIAIFTLRRNRQQASRVLRSGHAAKKRAKASILLLFRAGETSRTNWPFRSNFPR